MYKNYQKTSKDRRTTRYENYTYKNFRINSGIFYDSYVYIDNTNSDNVILQKLQDDFSNAQKRSKTDRVPLYLDGVFDITNVDDDYLNSNLDFEKNYVYGNYIKKFIPVYDKGELFYKYIMNYSSDFWFYDIPKYKNPEDSNNPKNVWNIMDKNNPYGDDILHIRMYKRKTEIPEFFNLVKTTKNISTVLKNYSLLKDKIFVGEKDIVEEIAIPYRDFLQNMKNFFAYMKNISIYFDFNNYNNFVDSIYSCESSNHVWTGIKEHIYINDEYYVKQFKSTRPSLSYRIAEKTKNDNFYKTIIPEIEKETDSYFLENIHYLADVFSFFEQVLYKNQNQNYEFCVLSKSIKNASYPLTLDYFINLKKLKKSIFDKNIGDNLMFSRGIDQFCVFVKNDTWLMKLKMAALEANIIDDIYVVDAKEILNLWKNVRFMLLNQEIMKLDKKSLLYKNFWNFSPKRQTV